MDQRPIPSLPEAAGPSAPEGYVALRTSVAWRDVSPRLAVALVGEDAVRFVDGFCTASVAAIEPGGGSEAFFLDARGQVSAWGTVLAADDGVWIDADLAPACPGEKHFCLRSHLETYHIRERLTIIDRSADVAALLVAGPDAGAWLENAGLSQPSATPIGHDVPLMRSLAEGRYPGSCAGTPVAVVRGEWAGAGSFLLLAAAADRASVAARLRADGVPEACDAALEAVRREEGRPAPSDIPARSLPQEFGRNRRAISFTKGCYLGQETVARLDALGHVNRRLVGIVTRGGRMPVPGDTVASEDDGAPLGAVTSAGPSPRHGGWLSLALVRTTALKRDARWRVAGVSGSTVSLAQTEAWE